MATSTANKRKRTPRNFKQQSESLSTLYEQAAASSSKLPFVTPIAETASCGRIDDQAAVNLTKFLREMSDKTVSKNKRLTAVSTTTRLPDAEMFIANPIIPCHGKASKQLRSLVHNWIWHPLHKNAFHLHRISAFAAMLEKRDDEQDAKDDCVGGGGGGGIGVNIKSPQHTILLRRTAKQLRLLHKLLRDRAAHVRMMRETHEYVVGEKIKVPQSVTGALDELCGTFDEDATIARMLNNKARWRQNKYYAKCNFDQFGNELSDEQRATRLRNEWREARDLGTRLHDWIDAGYQQSNDQQPPAAADVSAYNSWEAIRMFNDWLLLASEYPVYDLSCGLAGTIDAIYLPNIAYPRQVVLVDWKRSQITTTVGNMFYEHPLLMRYAKGNYWKYAMQLNLYRELLEANYGLQVIDMYLVTFPPQSGTCEVYGVPKMLEAKTFVASLRAREQARKA